MAELTEVVAEAAEDVASVAGDVAEASRAITGREMRLSIFGGVLGLIAGALVGGWYVEKRLRSKYETLAEEEIDAMREHFRARLVAKESKPDLEGLGKRVEDLGYVAPTEEAPIEEEEIRNVFEPIAWDMEKEKANRTPRIPYVIHVDERHKSGYTETTMTYFVGDDVLCDERDNVVPEPDDIVGVQNLDRFGHGSGDPNVVYIRNDTLGVDVEVVRSERTYAEDVHGMKHSDEPRERRPPWDG
jgi:hypothetical protein